MPGGGIQCQGREFNMPWKKEILKTASSEMIVKRRHRPTTLLLAVSVFFLQGCASVIPPSLQRIPVTSTPVGAKVFLDGKEMGSAPLTLRLKKTGGYHLRIEKEGYQPYEVRITSGRNPRVNAPTLIAVGIPLGGAIGGVLGATIGMALIPFSPWGEHRRLAAVGWGVVLGAIITPIAIGRALRKSGASSILSPTELNIELTQKGEPTRPRLAVLSSDQWSRVRWIRIHCSGSAREATVELKFAVRRSGD
jgi:hypothetical protein